MQDEPPLSVRRSWQPAISVVVPAYNEAVGLGMFHHRLLHALTGLASPMSVVLFLGGVQRMFLGVMGEYLGRVFNETRQRPLYLVERCVPSAVKASV